MKPHIDDENPWAGYWAMANCFGGIAADGQLKLNDEIQNVIAYLNQSGFISSPSIEKVVLGPPYDEIMDSSVPRNWPVVRIPVVGSSYLYNGDTDTGDHTLYANLIDDLVTILTNNMIAVIIDLHWDCPDTTTLRGCQTGAVWGQPSLPQISYGVLPGANSFWDQVSTKYANNPLVMYELYSKPNIDNFELWYAGDGTYAGMRELYDTIRHNDQDGLIIIGGKQQYALDAASGLGFYLRYNKENATYPHNVLWNVLPFMGQGQGLERSVRSIMRFALALKTVGPVIFTEVRQHCCGQNGPPCNTGGGCDDHAHGDH
jgi:hypothetical protein